MLALTGVAAGAFGSHVLRSVLAGNLQQTYEIAVRYQMWHSLALMGLALWHEWRPSGWLHRGGSLLLAGTLIFSGSLYFLCLTGVRWWGAVTPCGGVLLLLGWGALLLATRHAHPTPSHR